MPLPDIWAVQAQRSEQAKESFSVSPLLPENASSHRASDPLTGVSSPARIRCHARRRRSLLQGAHILLPALLGIARTVMGKDGTQAASLLDGRKYERHTLRLQGMPFFVCVLCGENRERSAPGRC